MGTEKNLRRLDDEQLAEQAKNGDSAAYDALLRRYVFLVHSRAAGYKGSNVDFEDLVQEGMIGLMHAVAGYDKDCGASFQTFARLCIDRNIISAVRATLRKKQIPKNSLVSIDDAGEPANTGDRHAQNPENVVIAKEELALLYQKIFASLNDFELGVLKLYLAGCSYRSIAEKFGCSYKAVDNAMQRLRRKLK